MRFRDKIEGETGEKRTMFVSMLIFVQMYISIGPS